MLRALLQPIKVILILVQAFVVIVDQRRLKFLLILFIDTRICGCGHRRLIDGILLGRVAASIIESRTIVSHLPRLRLTTVHGETFVAAMISIRVCVKVVLDPHRGGSAGGPNGAGSCMRGHACFVSVLGAVVKPHAAKQTSFLEFTLELLLYVSRRNVSKRVKKYLNFNKVKYLTKLITNKKGKQATLSYVVDSVYEWVVTTVAHCQPVTAEPNDINVTIPEIIFHLLKLLYLGANLCPTTEHFSKWKFLFEQSF